VTAPDSGSGRIQILTYQGVPIWRDDRVLRIVAQVVSAVVILGFLYFFITNVLAAAEARGLGLGFDFMRHAAGFPIGESIVQYDPSMAFGRAFLAGLVNTLRVSLVGIVLATALGILVGLARLSTNWLVRTAANIYVEVLRNVPLLVTLFILFFAVFQNLPSVQDSITLGNLLILNQRGVYMAWFESSASTGPWLLILLVALILAIAAYVRLTRRRVLTGRTTYPAAWALLIVVGLPLVGWLLLPERPLTPDVPVLGRFNYDGGIVFTTQFTALLVGLVIYTAAFIAEVVRAGVQSVSRGQVEAARAIGLRPLQQLRLVVFPQALRVITPPLISQYLNLTKNSSLAIAIGYPDLFAVGRIMINQAGRPVPVFALIMVTYLAISLVYSLILNVYNRRIQFVER
jgi:general L-amino acid transport system permease protein